VPSLAILIPAVLVLWCGQTDRITDAAKRVDLDLLCFLGIITCVQNRYRLRQAPVFELNSLCLTESRLVEATVYYAFTEMQHCEKEEEEEDFA